MDSYLEVWTTAGCELRPLGGARLTIGRTPTNDVSLGADVEVSRLHAVVESVGRGWVVRDLNSRNGTAVNGRRITGDQPLTPGDEVTIGSTRMVYRSSNEFVAEATVGAAPPPNLTARERDVLLALFRPAMSPEAFTEPASTREIANRLFVSEAAIKQHLAHLYDKFAIHPGLDRRRARLANEALRRGAVSMADIRDHHRGPTT